MLSDDARRSQYDKTGVVIQEPEQAFADSFGAGLQRLVCMIMRIAGVVIQESEKAWPDSFGAGPQQTCLHDHAHCWCCHSGI